MHIFKAYARSVMTGIDECMEYSRQSLTSANINKSSASHFDPVRVKARLHRRFLSRNSMQFLSRRSCIKFRACSKLDTTSARQK